MMRSAPGGPQEGRATRGRLRLFRPWAPRQRTTIVFPKVKTPTFRKKKP